MMTMNSPLDFNRFLVASFPSSAPFRRIGHVSLTGILSNVNLDVQSITLKGDGRSLCSQPRRLPQSGMTSFYWYTFECMGS